MFQESGEKWGTAFIAAKDKAKDLSNELGRLTKELAAATKGTADWDSTSQRLKIVDKDLKKATLAASNWVTVMKGGLTVINKLGSGIIGLGLGAFTSGLQQLSKQVYKVWDLFERWTKVMGEFNLKVGGASAGIKSAQKFGSAWEGSIRGLTDQMGVGMQMAGDFINEFDRMPLDTKAKEGGRFAKMMVGLARGFDLGGEGAAQFAKIVQGLSVDGVMSDEPKAAAKQYNQMNDAAADMFKDSAAAANAAGVPMNKFFKDIVKSKDFFAEVGESGRKGLTTAIGFVKKLGVSVQSLKKFTDGTDTFDDTAKAVAKLNTVFGSSINAMEVMLEQDPGKRFEIVRQGLLSQGKTFDQLSRMERKIIAETTNLSVEEVNAMLKSGMSLEDFEKKQAKAREKKLTAETMIRDAMQKTATTMHAFGISWDKVTMAVIKLIKPFTDMLGLTKSGEVGAKSFSKTMTTLFNRLIKFIEEVAANKDWQGFMKRLANDAKDLASRISAIATGPGLGEWINTVVKAGQDFYDIMKSAFHMIVSASKPAATAVKFIAENLKEILAIWVASKAVGMGAGIMGMGAAVGGSMLATGGAGLAMGAGGGVAGYVGGGMLSKAAGIKTGSSEGKAGGIGGGIGGGTIGMILGGPFGAALGAAAGAAMGRFLGDALAASKRSKQELELNAAVQIRTENEKKYSNQLTAIAEEENLRKQKRNQVDMGVQSVLEKMKESGSKVVEIEGQAKEQLTARIEDLMNFGSKSKAVATIFDTLSKGGGSLELTAEQLKSIQSESQLLATAMQKQRKEIDLSIKSIENEESARFNLTKAGIQVEQSKRQVLIDKLIEDVKTGPKNEREKKEKELTAAKDLQIQSNGKIENIQRQHADRIFSLQLRSQVMGSEAFQKFALSEGKGLGPEQMIDAFLKSEGGKSVPESLHQLIKIAGVYNKSDYSGGPPKRASGGIAMSPQHAIVGEAGPEAIIPLKALISGGDSLSASSIGAQAAEGIVNLAKGRGGSGSSGGTSEVVVEVPLYLDGSIIARAVSRAMLSNVDS